MLVADSGGAFAQSRSEATKWRLIETIINPDNAPLVFENIKELVTITESGRTPIDRDTTDRIDTVTITNSSMAFESRQVLKSIVTGEVKGELTYQAVFSFSPPPSELMQYGRDPVDITDVIGAYSVTRSGKTEYGLYARGKTFSISLGGSGLLGDSISIDEETPSNTMSARQNPSYRIDDREFRVYGRIDRCDACVIVWVYEKVDPDDPETETALESTAEPVGSDSAESPDPPSLSTDGESRSVAALDDLLNTFGRMTAEIAEERINVEMKDGLDELATWLGSQMESYLGDSNGFSDAVYDSLPGFAWQEQQDAGDIPTDVEDQPDDPDGPGLSFDALIDAMTKKVPIPSSLNSESGEELYELVTGMLWREDPETGRFIRTRSAGGEVIELRRADGTSVKTGIYVTPDGRVNYSTDGTNFYASLTDAIDPSYSTRGVETYRAVTGYLWQRSVEGRSLDGEQQLINEVSRDVLDEFRREMSASSASSAPESVYGELKDPFKDIKGIGKDPYAALEGKATKSAYDYIEAKLWDPVKGKLKAKRDEWLWAAAEKALDNSIEFETRQNFKFLLKEYQELGTDALSAWEEMKRTAGVDLFELTGVGKTAAASGQFMVSAIQEMGKGLQDSDFGVRARSYINLRQQGSSPEALWRQTRAGEIPELEFSTGRVTRSGIESTMAQQGIPPEVHIGLSFSLYEQSYQRLLLAQKLGRK